MKIASMSKKELPNKANLVPGSKVPVAFLIDYFKEGYSVSDFISSYPWIDKKDVDKALEEIKKREFTSSYAL